ncbi:MAG: glucokinase [Ignavibacteria bacterium]
MNSGEVVVGIDIGGTNTEIGIVDHTGSCLGRATLQTGTYDTPEAFVHDLHLHIHRLLERFSCADQLRGIGIGAPNGNYYRGTIEHAPNLRWRGIVPLAAMLHERVHVPVVLTNDANAAAMGEKIFGGAQGMTDFIVVTLGTGVGSGFFVQDMLVHGKSGFAGELGHIIVREHGRECGCGRRGCLETYASAGGIKRTAVELLAERSTASTLRHLAFDAMTAAAIAEAAQNDDPIAREAFERTGKILGTALADAVAYTSPEAIFLFGGLMNAGELLLEPTQRWFEHSLLNVYKGTVRLLPSSLHHNTGVLGAAAFVHHHLALR